MALCGGVSQDEKLAGKSEQEICDKIKSEIEEKLNKGSLDEFKVVKLKTQVKI